MEPVTHYSRRLAALRQQAIYQLRGTRYRCVRMASPKGAERRIVDSMAVYLISYDLDKPGQDYTDLIKAIEQIGGVKTLFSEWFVVTQTMNAKTIFDRLSPFVDSNDRLLVLGLSGEAWWYNLMTSNEATRKLLAA